MRQFPLILADKNPCPCALYGTAKQFNDAAFEFAERGAECVSMEGGKPHVSDQSCVQKWNWPAVDLCYQYGRAGWEQAKLVHYSHSSLCGRPRRDVIPMAEKMRNSKTITEPEKTPARTWIDGIREAADHLLKESKASDNNRHRIMQELKKRGLTPGGVKYAPDKVKKVPMKKGRKKQLAAV